MMLSSIAVVADESTMASLIPNIVIFTATTYRTSVFVKRIFMHQAKSGRDDSFHVQFCGPSPFVDNSLAWFDLRRLAKPPQFHREGGFHGWAGGFVF
jgi:hypothetical protein